MKHTFTLLAALLAAAAQAAETQLPKPAAELFPLADVRLLDPELLKIRELNHQYLLALDSDRLLRNYRENFGIKTGLPELTGHESATGPHAGARGHYTGHYLSACAMMIASTGDAKLKAKADPMVAELAKLQQPNGYLSAQPETYFDDLENNGRHIVWYSQHKLLAGLLDMYVLTGNPKALDVAKTFGDWVVARTGKIDHELMQKILRCEFGGIGEAMANLAAITGDKRYLKAAKCFDHDEVLKPMAAGQDSDRKGNKQLKHTLFIALLLAPLAASPAAETTPAPRPTEARPLLMGNWADPSILKDGDDYYMTHSSFEFQRGLLVWHSKDLRSWRPISRGVTNQPGSIWAPDLIKHDGKFYIYYPASGGNFVVTANSAHGPWSEPRSLGVGHIDPGHVVGADGKRHLHLSGGTAVELSPDGLQAVSKPRRIYEGWPIPPDWAIECFCLESPKLTKRGDWYYLTSAQGGTAGPATSHMVVSARSRNPLGPWENSPFNPIIRTWDRDEPWWSKGHGTLVEGPCGQWYCVLHGYLNGYRSLGRCTLIEPIEWTADGWFRVLKRWPTGWERAVNVAMPMSDSFDGPQLGIQWQFFQQYDAKRLAFADGALALKATGTNPGDSCPLCVMPLHRAYEIETEVEMEDDGTAGLMLFFSPKVFLGLAVDKTGAVTRVQNTFDRFGRGSVPQPGARRVTLRIVNNKQDVLAYVRDAAGHWQPVPPALEVSGADHNTLGGWHCVRPALFACGTGQARFHSFTYRPLE